MNRTEVKNEAPLAAKPVAEQVTNKPLTRDEREEYRKMAEALDRFLELPDSVHFLHFIDGPSGPVHTPSAIAYRRLRHAANIAKVTFS